MSNRDIISKIVHEHLREPYGKRKDFDHNKSMADLGADSLDNIEIVMAVESELDVVIPDNIVENHYSIDGLVKFLETQPSK